MIRTTRNPILGSASFWTQDLSILGFKTKTLSELVSDMFKNGEQGFFYDPNSLTDGTYGVDQTNIGVPVTVGVADAAEYDSVLHTGMVYRADQYNQSIVNFDVDNTKSHELVIENTGSTTIAVNADLAMGAVLFTVAAGQRVTRILNPVQVIVITSANDVSTAYFKIHSLKEFSGQYTMFQNAAGTIPVTGVGQPVGLVLDKSKGLVVGTELIADPSFDDPSYWGTVSPTVVVTGGNAVFTNSLTGNSVFADGITLPNKWYKVKIVVSSITSGAVRPNVSVGTSELIAPNITSAGVYTFTLLCSASIGRVQVTAIGTTNAVVSEFSVKELAGNHAYQTNSASRPILRQNATTGAYYLEFDGSDDFLQTSNIDFTATNKMSLFAGVRKLGTTRGTIAELGTTGFGRFILNSNRVDTTSFSYLGENVSPFPSVQSAASAVLSAQSNLSANVHSLKVNNVKNSSSWVGVLSTTYQNAAVYIGRQGGTGFSFNGHIYSLIGVGRLTTDSETVAIEKELAKRTGVTLS